MSGSTLRDMSYKELKAHQKSLKKQIKEGVNNPYLPLAYAQVNGLLAEKSTFNFLYGSTIKKGKEADKKVRERDNEANRALNLFKASKGDLSVEETLNLNKQNRSEKTKEVIALKVGKNKTKKR